MVDTKSILEFFNVVQEEKEEWDDELRDGTFRIDNKCPSCGYDTRLYVQRDKLRNIAIICQHCNYRTNYVPDLPLKHSSNGNKPWHLEGY